MSVSKEDLKDKKVEQVDNKLAQGKRPKGEGKISWPECTRRNVPLDNKRL